MALLRAEDIPIEEQMDRDLGIAADAGGTERQSREMQRSFNSEEARETYYLLERMAKVADVKIQMAAFSGKPEAWIEFKFKVEVIMGDLGFEDELKLAEMKKDKMQDSVKGSRVWACR